MLIKLKLGKCTTMPTKRARKELGNLLHQINRSKTHTERSWWLQQEDTEKFQWLSTYKIGREPCQEVQSRLISAAFNQVRDRLKSKTPYNAKGNHKFTWQAILGLDEQLAVYRGRSFPVPQQCFSLAWRGMVAGESYAQNLLTRSITSNQPLFRFVAWSKLAGRKNTTLTFRLVLGKMSTGHKIVLQQILDADHYFKACDSSIVIKDGAWYLHLVYKDTRDLPKLEFDEERAMIIYCNHPGQQSGFVAEYQGRKRYFGPNNIFARHMQKRKAQCALTPIQDGHGVNKALKRRRAIVRRQNRDIDRNRKLWISDIVKFAKQFGAAGVLYREPSLGHGVRAHEWMAAHGINFNWTKFESDLKAKMEQMRIAYRVKRMKTEEWKKRVNWESPFERRQRLKREANAKQNGNGKHGNGKQSNKKDTLLAPEK